MTTGPVKNNDKTLRIAIIGAGIGGLAFAAALSHLIPKERIEVNIYEQAHEVKEIGAGILAWPRTWKVLQSIGVTDALEQHLEKKPNNNRALVWKIIKSDQPQGADIFELYQDGRLFPWDDTFDAYEPYPGAPSLFHRAVLQKTLLDSLPPSIQVHLSHKLASYDEAEEHVVLHFDNQESQICDFLVAADGIKSGIRAKFISKCFPEQQKSIDPVWGGTVVYRSLVRADKIRELYPDHNSLSKTMMYAGDGHYSVTYPIMQGRFINVAALVTDSSKEGTRPEGPTKNTSENLKEHVLTIFNGWSEEYLGLIKNADSFSQWTVQYLHPLKHFAAGRVALLGDAAHAMTPNLGSGAGQGIEDAYTLAQLVLKALQNQIPVPRITEAYTKTREPLANYVLQRSDYLGRLASFRVPGYEGINGADEETVKILFGRFTSDFKSTFDWWETYPVDSEVEKALNML